MQNKETQSLGKLYDLTLIVKKVLIEKNQRDMEEDMSIKKSRKF